MPAMLYAKILRPPAHGVKLKSVDTSEAKKTKDVLVVEVHDDPRLILLDTDLRNSNEVVLNFCGIVIETILQEPLPNGCVDHGRGSEALLPV